MDLDEDDREEDEAVHGVAHTGKCLLGVLSGSLEDKYVSDVTCSRAGGPPVWCGDLEPPTVLPCTLCKAPLWLVAQFYAPITGHRVLHVFGCNQKSCSLRRETWRCYRTESAATEDFSDSTVQTNEIAPTPAAVSEWEATDWDVCEGSSAALDQSIATLLGGLQTAGRGAGQEQATTVPASAASSKAPAAELKASGWQGPVFPPQWLDTVHEPSAAQSGVSDEHVAAALEAFLDANEDPDAVAQIRDELQKSGGGRGCGRGGGSSGNRGGGGIRGGGGVSDKDEEAGYESTPADERELLRFQGAVRRCPAQGVRYEWAGQPLWSRKHKYPKPPACKCGAPRAFELQLMPSLLFALKVDDHYIPRDEASSSEIVDSVPLVPPSHLTTRPPQPGDGATDDDDDDEGEMVAQNQVHAQVHAETSAAMKTLGKKPEPQGMDWGTVAIFSCSNSCSLSSEEYVVVQPPVD